MAFLTGNKKQIIDRIAGIEGHVGSLKRLFDEDRWRPSSSAVPRSPGRS